MALTLTQELEVISGGISPVENSLLELIYQASIKQSITFLSTGKNIDNEVNPDAFGYQRKIGNVVSKIVAKNTATIDTIRKVFISLVGSSAFTYDQVSNATDASWETFISDNIAECIEIVGLVLPHEKTEFDSL